MKLRSISIFAVLIAIAGCGGTDQSGELSSESVSGVLTTCLTDKFPFVSLDPIFVDGNKAKARFEFHFKPDGTSKFVVKEGTAVFEQSADGKWYLQRVRTDNKGPQNRCKGPLLVE